MRRVHAAWASAIAVLIVAFTTIFLIDWAPVAGDGVTRSVSQALGRSVTIAGSIRMRPTFSGLKGRASGIVIGNPEWARTDEFASIDKAEITFSWWPLLIGTLEPNRIEIKGALFELESRPVGAGQRATWQIGTLDPDRSPEEAGSLRVRRLPRIVLEDASLAVTDAYGQLHDIAVHKFKIRRKGRGAIASARLGDAATPVKIGWAINSLKDLGSESSEMALTIESEAGTVTANGTLGFHPDAGFDLRSHWDISSLGQFTRNFGLTGLPDEMPLTANIRTAGSAKAFAVQLEKIASGPSQAHGVLQGRFMRQGAGGSTVSLLELTGEVASQHLDTTSVLAPGRKDGTPKGRAGTPNGASLVDFMFGPGLVFQLDVEISALQLVVNDTVLKNVSGRVISDTGLLRFSSVSGKLGSGNLALDLVMDRAGTDVQDVALLISGRDLDLGWLFGGLGVESLLVAPTDFAANVRSAGANTEEMLANLTGAVHFAAGHGAMRGAAARGLGLSGLKLPRLEGKEAFPLECLAGRVNFARGVGVLNGFMMRGAGYDVMAEGYADMGRQMVDIRFSPAISAGDTQSATREPVPYRVTGPASGPTVSAVPAGSQDVPSVAVQSGIQSISLPALRGEVARNNPCLAGMRTARAAAQESAN